MAERARNWTTKPPRQRERGKTYFYASEVVQILGLDGIDYRQLRRILRLVRPADDQPQTDKWSRYEFEDLVAVRAALKVIGAKKASASDRRWLLSELECACRNLRALGIAKPLTEVALERRGSEIIAKVDGVSFRPASGQLSLQETFDDTTAYLQGARGAADLPLAAICRDVKAKRVDLRATSRQRRKVRLSRNRRSEVAGGRVHYLTLDERPSA